MAQEIHARKTGTGETSFRVWSTITDSYLTAALTESQVREWILEEALDQAKRQHQYTIDARIQRAEQNGTSSELGDRRNLFGPWDRKRQ